jgi:hypothetical protein
MRWGASVTPNEKTALVEHLASLYQIR